MAAIVGAKSTEEKRSELPRSRIPRLSHAFTQDTKHTAHDQISSSSFAHLPAKEDLPSPKKLQSPSLLPNLYFLEKSGPTAFAVGTDDPTKRFRVTLGPQSCSCKHRNCEHLQFVMQRVLKLSIGDPRLLAKSLQNFEIDELLAKFEEVRSKCLRRPTRSTKPCFEPADCAICLLEMSQEEKLLSCSNCRNFLHEHCMSVWADSERQQRDEVHCPLCRSLWVNAPGALAQLVAADAAGAARFDVDLPVVPLVCLDTMRFARPWAQAFGERLVSCFVSSEWSVREAALRKLGHTINDVIGQDATLLPVVMAMLLRACGDAVFKIYETALQIIISLRSLHDPAALVPVVERILLKCGWANGPTRLRSHTAIFQLLNRGILTQDALLESICSVNKETVVAEGDTPVQPWQWYLGRLSMLSRLLDERTVTDAPSLARIRLWCSNLMDYPHLRVRQQARMNFQKIGDLKEEETADTPTPSPPVKFKRPQLTACQRAMLEDADECLDLESTDSDADDACGADAPHLTMTTSALGSIVFDSAYHEGTAWTKGELIGTGAFSSVYRGIDRHTCAKFAVKQLCLCGNSKATERCILQSVERELALIKRLPCHENTVVYFGSVSEANHVNIFMEIVEGGSLVSFLEKNGPLKPRLVGKYGRQILLGLVHLHRHGIIHRDVKGANILVDEARGLVKLCDYGASALLEANHTKHGEFVSSHGTPAFMAPEVIRGESYGRRSDIWSFACTVIEMASGLPPWAELTGANPFALMFKIASSTDLPALPEELGEEGKAILTSCFQRDHKLRPSAEELLAHGFFA